ncbi:MAG: hypothetical protein ACM31H_05755 [Nitrososphaerales archaeon]|jgi:hypothetical protein
MKFLSNFFILLGLTNYKERRQAIIHLNMKEKVNKLKYLNKRLNQLDYDEGIKIICTHNNYNIFINKNINNEFIIQIENVIQKNKKQVLYFEKRNDLISFIQKNCTTKFDFVEY